GVWVELAKKDSGIQSPSHAEALEVALCYGWIDGRRRSKDAKTFLQHFAPRGPRSIWSKINREKAELLIKTGKMKPPGLAAVELARADGRWKAAYAGQKTITVPPDLQAALDRHPGAKAFFATLTSQNRYSILFRLHQAKKPETRAARLEKFVAMLKQKKTIHPQK
ncbi:MAG: YdeI/OmpD-associated family protein, partial [Bdellovibrionota bacterium]